MSESDIRDATRREVLGGAAVVLGGAVLGKRASDSDSGDWGEEPAGSCGIEYDEEFEALLAAVEEPQDWVDPDEDVYRAPKKWRRPVRRRVKVTARYRMRGNWAVGYHTGIDLAVPRGTPVYSVGPGVVVLARWSGSYGKAVTVKMSDRRYVVYAHLSRISVERGDKVRPGTRLGNSGSTGRATGPHLHFEVRTRRKYGSDIDPVKYLARHGLRL
ncbi:M23 family metallopeptidase [Streptomyces sp. GESEQ-4]|uniref:M23 family metallopeptidase n=1 Tax=Streptomyces sp. GESEQ-4 TaxID=2812655 RepID=UPI001B31ED36|nr:M23 family metallopeptidase [Streptomyces sp. GESEQ-4]